MRSPDEMKRFVHREAARRRNRRRAVVAGTAGVFTIVLVGVSLTRPSTETPTEVSTASDGVAPTNRGSVVHPAVDDAAVTTPSVVGTGDPPQETVVAAGEVSPTTRPNPPLPQPAASDEPAPGPDPDPGPTSPTVPPAGPDPTTTTTTTLPVRVCGSDDFILTDLDFAVPGDPQWFAEGTAPIGHPTEFEYSTLARPGITPCRTPDSLQRLTITDADGVEVFRHTYDGGQGRLVTPGSWVMFRGNIAWDPSCPAPTTGAPFTVSCVPVGLGTYTVNLYDQGASFPARTVTIVPEP